MTYTAKNIQIAQLNKKYRI